MPVEKANNGRVGRIWDIGVVVLEFLYLPVPVGQPPVCAS